MKRIEPTEFQEQCAVIDWWSVACKSYNIPEYALFSIPNGAHLAGDTRSRAIKMANLKRTGLRVGIPDLFLAVPRTYKGRIAPYEDRPVFPGLFIEMKRKKGKPPTPEQEAVILYLRQRGYHVVVARGAEEAIRAIQAYLS